MRGSRRVSDGEFVNDPELFVPEVVRRRFIEAETVILNGRRVTVIRDDEPKPARRRKPRRPAEAS